MNVNHHNGLYFGSNYKHQLSGYKTYTDSPGFKANNDNSVKISDSFSLKKNPAMMLPFKANFSNSRANNKLCIHDTFFFRDIDLLDFVIKYINDNYKNEDTIRIADFGCSDGSEAYSLRMLLNDNKELQNKIKITGYDISPKIIESLKDGVYTFIKLRNVYDEDSLFISKGDNFFISNKDKHPEKPDITKKYKNLLNAFLTETASKEIIADSSPDAGWLQRKKFSLGSNEFDKKYCIKSFKINEDLRKSVNFEIASIENIGQDNLKFTETEKPQVIIFKNAWYHLTGNKRAKNVHEKWATTKEFEKLAITIKNIHDNLADNGILVVGNLDKDHIYYDKSVIARPNPFHKLLLNKGFEPVPESYQKVAGFPELDEVPTVWRKKKKKQKSC